MICITAVGVWVLYLVHREKQRARAQREAFEYDEYRKTHPRNK